MSEDKIHGFADGDRVRDIRDGSVGVVRFLELSPAERESGDYAEAEIVWNGGFVSDELAEHLLPHLERG